MEEKRNSEIVDVIKLALTENCELFLADFDKIPEDKIITEYFVYYIKNYLTKTTLIFG